MQYYFGIVLVVLGIILIIAGREYMNTIPIKSRQQYIHQGGHHTCRGKELAAAVILLLILALLTGCGSGVGTGSASAAEPVTGENYYLDTICTISVYAMRADQNESAEDNAASDTSEEETVEESASDDKAASDVIAASEDEERANSAIRAAFDLCAALDKKLSRTQAASEISRVNAAGGEWTEVSDDTLELVKAGKKYSELSDGDFDISIGGVTDLWDFHADPEDAKLPDASVVKEAVKHVGYNNIEINGNKLRIVDSDTRIDLGGIAKGYIGDRMTEVLEEQGVTSGIINLGGNVICIGGKYTGDAAFDDFVVGVEAPFSDRTEIVGKIRGRDKTFVTSGIYERKIEVDGKLYHHILNTKTGYSAETDLDAVTLAGDKGRSMDLDALSTICLIKGLKEAKKLIEKTDGVEAVFILHDGSIDQTSGMEFEAE